MKSSSPKLDSLIYRLLATNEGMWPSDLVHLCKRAAEQLAASPPSLEAVTRFEVFDEDGNSFRRRPVHVELHYQDDGRTLKVFLRKRATDEAADSPTKRRKGQ